MEVAQSAQSLNRLLKRCSPLLIVVAVGIFYSPTLGQLFGRWTQWDESMAHGLPILLIFLVLLYQRSLEFAPLQSPFWDRGLAALALLGSICLWAVFHRVSIQTLEQLVLLPILLSSFWLVYGFQRLWQHRLLLLLPLFAIPVWDYLNGPLLYLSSNIVGQMVRWVQMPAIIEGSSIFIPYGHILIADGCSGLRYFVVALALGYLVGLLNGYREGRMALILLVAGGLGLVTNWLRIFILIVIGYKTRMESELMTDHETFGWVLFALVCLPALYFAPVIKRRLAKSENAQEASAQSAHWTWVSVLLVGLSLGPLLAWGLSGHLAQQPPRPLLGDGGQPLPADAMPMPLQLPQAQLTEAVRLPGGPVYLRLDHYQRQSRSDQLVPYMGRLYDDANWRALDSGAEPLGERSLPWVRYKHKSGNRYVLQSQWFRLGERTTGSVKMAKLWQIPALFSGVTEFLVTSVQIECGAPGCERAKSNLMEQAQAQMQLQSQKEP